MRKNQGVGETEKHDYSRNDFSIEFRGDYIYVIHAPDFEITPDSKARLWSALAVECETYNCRRVLTEGKRVRREMSFLEVFDSAKQLSNIIPGLRLAFCFENYPQDELTGFFKTAASNRGVKINFFSDCREALGWLGVEDSKFN